MKDQIFEDLPCAAIVLEVDSGLICANNALFRQWFGDRQGQHLQSLVGESQRDALGRALCKAVFSLGAHLENPQGEQVPVQLALKISEIDGMRRSLCVVSKDQSGPGSVTIDHATRSRFFSKMGHEMRTPLNAILGYSEMYLEGLDEIDPEELAADLTKIVDSGKRLLTTIDEVVALAKNQSASVLDYDPEAMIARIDELQRERPPSRGTKEILTAGDAEVLAGARILLVEDHILNQELAIELLEAAGLSVTLAENGQQALDILFDHDFDAVLMDIHMPEMDGYEATQKIRAQARYATLPVIAMTSGATDEDRDQAAAAGMNDFISKPFDLDLTLQTLRKWIC